MLRDLVEFEQRLSTIVSVESLSKDTESFTRTLGCRWFTLIRAASGGSDNPSLLMTNYPNGWVQRVLAERRHLSDPIHAAVSRSLDGVQWCEVDKVIKLNSHQRETLAIASDHGLRNGFTIPVCLPGASSVMFSVALTEEKAMEPELILATRILSGIVYAKANKLEAEAQGLQRPVSLSPRQIECIRLIAQGFTDHAIGQRLELSPETVREYVEAARKRYGVKRRAQLVIRAIHDNYLTVEEAVDWSF